MARSRGFLSALLTAGVALAALGHWAEAAQSVTFRVLSWNVSGDPPVAQSSVFQGHLRLANADIVLLDEVLGSLPPETVKAQFPKGWQFAWGARGGRQRTAIASRFAMTQLQSFDTNTYPERERQLIIAAAPDSSRELVERQLSLEMSVSAGLIRIGGKSLLVVIADLMCCAAERWQELRRMTETRAIRRLVQEAIGTHSPDGLIVAGDFNLASPPGGNPGTGVMPLAILSGPYPAPLHGLIAAEAIHRDGNEVWTIDADAKRVFPAMPFDFQLYSPRTLRVREALVIDTADYETSELARVGLTAASSKQFSQHRPVVVSYDWSSGK